jgi:DNA-3-methyladenine glycosylase II
MNYLLHLAKDKKLKKLIEGAEPLSVRRSKDILFYLIASIMSQQLSTKVADTIKNRFMALYNGRIPLPDEVLATAPETLRSIGLSNAKVSYVLNVARFALEHGLDDEVLHKMDNEDVIAYLTQIKGVGRWTVEMLLMFGLGREDIFAIDDWGVQNAMIHIYKLDRTDKKAFREALLRISQKWSPYRTYACMHLWRWKDNSPVVTPTAKKPSAPAKKPSAQAKKATVSTAKSPTAKTISAASKKKAAPATKKPRPKTVPTKKSGPRKISR